MLGMDFYLYASHGLYGLYTLLEIVGLVYIIDYCINIKYLFQEHSFIQTYFADLQDAQKFCEAYKKSGNMKELTQAWEIYYAVGCFICFLS